MPLSSRSSAQFNVWPYAPFGSGFLPCLDSWLLDLGLRRLFGFENISYLAAETVKETENRREEEDTTEIYAVWTHDRPHAAISPEGSSLRTLYKRSRRCPSFSITTTHITSCVTHTSYHPPTFRLLCTHDRSCCIPLYRRDQRRYFLSAFQGGCKYWFY